MNTRVTHGLKFFLGVVTVSGWLAAPSTAADKDQPKQDAKKPAAAAKSADSAAPQSNATKPAARQASEKDGPAAAGQAKRAADKPAPKTGDAAKSRPNATEKRAAPDPAKQTEDRTSAGTKPADADESKGVDRKSAASNQAKERDTERDNTARPAADRAAGANAKSPANGAAQTTINNQQIAQIGINFGAAATGGGLVISSIGPNTAFANVGFLPGDQFISAGGQRFNSSAAFYQWLTGVQLGQRVAFVVLRNGQQQTMYWTPTQEFIDEFVPASGTTNFLGIHLDEQVQDAAVVADVDPSSPAQRAGVRQNDVILGVNGEQVKGLDDFANAMAQVPAGSNVDLSISRSKKLMKLQIVQGNVQQGVNRPTQTVAPAVVPAPSPVAPAPQPQPGPLRGVIRGR